MIGSRQPTGGGAGEPRAAAREVRRLTRRLALAGAAEDPPAALGFGGRATLGDVDRAPERVPGRAARRWRPRTTWRRSSARVRRRSALRGCRSWSPLARTPFVGFASGVRRATVGGGRQVALGAPADRLGIVRAWCAATGRRTTVVSRLERRRLRRRGRVGRSVRRLRGLGRGRARCGRGGDGRGRGDRFGLRRAMALASASTRVRGSDGSPRSAASSTSRALSCQLLLGGVAEPRRIGRRQPRARRLIDLRRLFARVSSNRARSSSSRRRNPETSSVAALRIAPLPASRRR